MPDRILEMLQDLPEPRDQGVRWVPIANRHITLQFLGDVDAEEAIERLGDKQFPQVEARLGPAIDVLFERALAIPVAGIETLATQTRNATKGLVRPDRRPFVGHLTVARLGRRARPTRILGQMFNADFPVHEVSLISSTLTDAGSEYETLATWHTR